MERYEDDSYCYYNYLAHHGTKGMKWGIRRFQRKDGSLTPEGKKRRSLGQVIKDHKTAKKRKAALEKAREAKVTKKKSEEKRLKKLDKGLISPKKMTDEELKRSIERKKAEMAYQDLTLETSATKRFINNAWNNAIEPALVNAGKNALTNFANKKLDDLLGNNKKNVMQILKEQADMAKLKRDIADFTAQEKKIKAGDPTDDEAHQQLKKKYEQAKWMSEIADYENKYKKSKASDNKMDSLERENKKTKLEREIAENRKQTEKAKNDDSGIEELEEKARYTKALSNIAINTHNYEKYSKSGESAAEKAKEKISNTKVDDLKKKPSTVKSGESWVQNASGIWLSNSTFRKLEK